MAEQQVDEAKTQSKSKSAQKLRKTDLEIAQNAKLIPIANISKSLGLEDDEIELYGKYKAKVNVGVLKRLKKRPNGNYIVVTGINPTSLGEGKSTTTVGLAQSLGAHLKKKAFVCIRQPSQGPTFGIKGGAAGGGYSQVIPMEDFNLHLTGDIHAVTAANNLLAAQIDSRIFHEATQSTKKLFENFFPLVNGKRKPFSECMKRRLNRLGIKASRPEDLSEEEKELFCRLNIDPSSITISRVLDTNDRMLRSITIGQGEAEHKGKYSRSNVAFDITVASEVMSILTVATSLIDLRLRLQNIVIGTDHNGNAVTCDDLGCAGAMAVLLKDAIHPTLMQTLEATPVFVHCGPFANISLGNSSVISDQIALKLIGEDGYVVTEAGFGADIGMEKFMNMKCRFSGLEPTCVCLVATVRALRMHGKPHAKTGQPVSSKDKAEEIDWLEHGCSNMQHHIKTAAKFGVPVVVAINQFDSDTDEEINLIKKKALEAGAFDAQATTHWQDGGKGALGLASAIVKCCQVVREDRSKDSQKYKFKFLYPDSLGIKEKIETIAREVYGAKGVKYSDLAEQRIASYTKLGYSELPICIAKTQYTLSDRDEVRGRGVPTDFEITIQTVNASVGAGYLYPMCGPISKMPGLGTRPSFFEIDIDPETGKISGLS